MSLSRQAASNDPPDTHARDEKAQVARPSAISPSAHATVDEGPVTFKIGDKAVFPMHGVGEVTAIEEREISGSSQRFYILRILDNGMKIMIPTSNVRQARMRQVIGADKVEGVLEILRAKALSVDTMTWNRRYREYTEKISTGSVFEVAEVLRDLYLLKCDKDLSFCELKLLDQARSLLVKELAVAQNCDEEDIKREFKDIFDA